MKARFVSWGWLLPGTLTLANLTLGFFAIILALRGVTAGAVQLIILAIFLDYADGTVARALGAQSQIGKQLDSLSDLVSFGVAPGMVCWAALMGGEGHPSWLAAAFPLCGAYRLARFNLENRGASRFIGLPIPGAGGLLAISCLYLSSHTPQVITVILIALAASMVSHIPFASLKTLPWAEEKPIVTLMLLVLVLSASLLAPWFWGILLASYFFWNLLLYFRTRVSLVRVPN